MTDFITGYNNGTLVIMPHPEGKAKVLCQENPKGNPRGWVFGDYGTYNHNGHEYINHIRRGALMGSHDDATAFIKMLKEEGYTVDNQGMGVYVPLSNGMNRYSNDSDGETMHDYDMEELSYCRYDLPTKETLAFAIEYENACDEYLKGLAPSQYNPYHTDCFADDDIPF